MALLAAHINDAAISLLNAGGVLYREPGFALLDDGHIVTGEVARATSRLKPRSIHYNYWSHLTTDALKDARFAHLSAADLVSSQMEAMWSHASDGDQLVVAVPPGMSREQVALFLGIANELSIPVVGLCDAAVAATRREYKSAVPIHVDLGLHNTTLTRLLQPSRVRFERMEMIEDAGVHSLASAWIRKISDCFVNQSRFDPLHTAETEQLLFDRLPAWLAQTSGSDTISMRIEYRGLDHAAEIETIDLIAAAGPVYQRIAAQMRALVRAGETPAIQMTERAAAMPGLADMLRARVGGEVFLLEPGATARGLLARFEASQSGSGAVTLLQQLPWDQSAVAIREHERASGDGTPTHVLFDSAAYRIGDDPIQLGSQRSEESRWIDFKRDMPGVSRQHCSILMQNGQCVLNDQSRYGTFLNGHRIDGSAVLQCGDVIRLGTPGFELQLIRTVD